MHSSASRSAQGSGRSFRLGLAQRALPGAIGFLSASLVLYVGHFFTDDPMSAGDLAQLLGWSLVGVAVLALTGRRRGVILTEDALVVVNGARRVFPWPGIERLQVRRVLGVSQVVAHLADGRRTTLPAPTSFVDPRFEEKVRELTECWQERRLSPPPAAAPPPAPAP
ncbi:hypothetical protein [Streptomyces griseoruber]|uniref:hypothetical protein n=1 Tax=Streptomyces griseoruber TaxID=1943 RepID=UPI00131BA3F9|nr:hypothetical protein [Streptomyces griseoruber]